MKKISYVFVLLLMFLVFNLNVDAKKAKIPDTLPDANDVLQGVTDDGYDFSAIEFSTSPEGKYVTGDSYMEKIILYEDRGGEYGSGEYEGYLNAFTAYCLNSRKKYPDYYVINDMEGTALFENYASSAVFDDSAFKNVFNAIEGFNRMDTTTGIVDPTQAEIDSFLAGETVTAHVNFIAFQWPDGEVGRVSAQKLIEAKGGTYEEGDTYDVTFSIRTYIANRFITQNMPNNTYFNRALWIIEHSYPTLTVEESLKAAGADYQTLLVELASLFPEDSSDELAVTAENYIYGTVQYAIWKVENSKVIEIDDEIYTLGNSIRGSQQLNLLYRYLIKDRKIYSSYGNSTFDNTFELSKPTKEIYEETSNAYIYGPYTVVSSLLTIGDASLSIENDNKTGISIINKAGDKIEKVTNEEEFYIKITKASKVANVKLRVSTENGIKFDPESNRGRIYEPMSALDQNVASGGIAVAAKINTVLELVYNPKTGVEDIGLILLIALGAFVIGYIALSFKSKPLDI